MEKKTVLIVDDQSDIRMSAALVLGNQGYQCLEAASPVEALTLLRNKTVDLLLLDMNFHKDTTSGEEGLYLLRKIEEQGLKLPVVVMTAWASVDIAVQAMQLGAGDFIEKPWQNNRLVTIVRQQLQQAHLQRENARYSQMQTEPQMGAAEKPLASSLTMKRLLTQAEQVAQTDASILITGDNGTGKSMLAQYIHQCSQRASARFVSANMGAIPESLFESELFGHKRGAFTDAREDRLGRFDLAQDGTLFLDEIGTLPTSLQSKLLRVLESGEYECLGSSKTLTSNARIITATNADLPALISKGCFRQDLLYRLNTVQLHVSSLKERKEDILTLAQHFLQKHGAKYQRRELRLSDNAIEVLTSYDWPGNVRELSHCIERSVILAATSVIEPDELSLTTKSAQQGSTLMSLEDGERFVINNALTHFKGNVMLAGEYLNLSKSTIYRRLEKLGIELKKP
jgi:DNA-binding NtrC family response regulator